MLCANIFSVTNKRAILLTLCTFLAIIILASDVQAGAGGMEFEDVWMTLKDWSQGTLGRIIAGAMIIVGLVGGIVRQSLLGLALGIGGGLGLYNAPDIIESLVSATIIYSSTANDVVINISNGLI